MVSVVVLVDFCSLGWVRVAVDEPSDEPLRKGETQKTKLLRVLMLTVNTTIVIGGIS